MKIILHVQQEHIASTLASVLAISALNAVLDITLNTNYNVRVRNLVASLPQTVSFLVLLLGTLKIIILRNLSTDLRFQENYRNEAISAHLGGGDF